MCYLEGTEHFTSCMVCLVKDAHTGRLFASCSVPVSEGQNIITNDAETTESRKAALELLLSEHVGDCEAPCQLVCPAHMNIPLMNRLIAKGDFARALEVVKRDIALPSILGRICPAPCEAGCRRKQVDEAVKNGAKLHLGGKAVAREGNFFEPTILTGITRDNPAYFEEFFGPVAQIYVVKNDEEAIQLANDSHYGLGGAVFSQDIERAKRMASAIETGMVYINWLTDTAPELPFGGVKRSGYGRELSDLGIKEFVNQKLVVVRR